jgi:hypothetical protein
VFTGAEVVEPVKAQVVKIEPESETATLLKALLAHALAPQLAPAAPIFNLTLPEMAPQIAVSTPDVIVPAARIEVQPGPAPVVNVTTPEVVVNLPERKPVTKTVKRDAQGAIVAIEEDL